MNPEYRGAYGPLTFAAQGMACRRSIAELLGNDGAFTRNGENKTPGIAA